jgi:hypothetical protein
MSTYTISTALVTIPKLSAQISVLLRGETGIGKSYIVKGLGKSLGMKVIDRRLSQMTEGDLLGLPSIVDGTTQWNPPDWFHEACEHGVILFLDEMNRATREVQQGAFQLVLDRELNGHKLHPDTRVYAAVNVGGKYSVTDMDAALLRRFFVVDLQPDVADWLAYARAEGISDLVVAFVAANESMLDPAAKSSPGSVQPTRASWERFDLEIRANDIAEKPGDQLYFNLAKGFLGAEVASCLVQYGKTHKFQVSGEDVWYRYADKKSGVAERMKHLGQEQWLSVIQRTCDYCKKWKTVPPECGPNLKAFYNDMPIELRPETWGKLVMAGSSEVPDGKKDHAEFAKSMHPYIVHELVTGTFGVPVGAKGVNVKPCIPKVLQDRLDANKGK